MSGGLGFRHALSLHSRSLSAWQRAHLQPLLLSPYTSPLTPLVSVCYTSVSLCATPLYHSVSLSTPFYDSVNLSTPLQDSVRLSTPLYHSVNLSMPLYHSVRLASIPVSAVLSLCFTCLFSFLYVFVLSLSLCVSIAVCLYHCMSLSLYVSITVCLYHCMSLSLYALWPSSQQASVP